MSTKLGIFGILVLFFTPELFGQRGFSTHLVYPVRTNQTETFSKIELGLRIPDSLYSTIAFLAPEDGKLNPYDPADVDIVATFTGETQTIKRHGFVYVPYERGEQTWQILLETMPFRVRFAAPETGQWSAEVVVKLRGIEVYKSDQIPINVYKGDLPGYLVLEEGHGLKSRYFKESNTGKGVVPVGESIGWSSYDFLKPSDHNQMVKWMQELSEGGGDIYRVWMKSPAYGIEWEHLGHYGSRMIHAWELDQLFDVSDMYDLYIQLLLVINESEQYWPDNTLWVNNPYKLGLGLNGLMDFITNAEARKLLKRRLRYIEARWGWSPKLCIYELFSEPERLFDYEDSNKEHHKQLTSWVNEMSSYLKDSLNSKHATLVSFMREGDDAKSKFWKATNLDIAGLNKYARHHGANYELRAGLIDKIRRNKGLKYMPFQFTEMGLAVYPTMEFCTDNGFHNAIWSTTFMGSVTSGLNWWWDNALHPNGYFVHYMALKKHLERFDPWQKGYDTQRGINKMGHKKATIEYYSLVDEDKTHALGWAHNNTWWWYRLRSYNDCIEKMMNREHRFDKADDTDYNYRIPKYHIKPPTLLKGEHFCIKNLKKSAKYELVWYSAYGGGEEISRQTIKSNSFGKLKVEFPVSEKNPKEHDFAFELNLRD